MNTKTKSFLNDLVELLERYNLDIDSLDTESWETDVQTRFKELVNEGRVRLRG